MPIPQYTSGGAILRRVARNLNMTEDALRRDAGTWAGVCDDAARAANYYAHQAASWKCSPATLAADAGFADLCERYALCLARKEGDSADGATAADLRNDRLDLEKQIDKYKPQDSGRGQAANTVTSCGEVDTAGDRFTRDMES